MAYVGFRNVMRWLSSELRFTVFEKRKRILEKLEPIAFTEIEWAGMVSGAAM